MFCFVENTFMFTLLYYFCCDIVARSLTYSHEILGIWCSIPQTANDKSIVRAPGNLSSVPPPNFLGGANDPVGSKDKDLSLHVLMPPYNKIATWASHSLLYDPMFFKGLMTFNFQYPRPKLLRGTYSLTRVCIEIWTENSAATTVAAVLLSSRAVVT
jgi:hypothetical protein